jgi:glycosyltransferase involved in cell wall biosynthesis
LNHILLVCPEPLGHRHPAGVGIRFLEFARALQTEGHQVTLLSLDGGAVPGCDTAVISPEQILQASRQADAAVVQGHAANDYFAHAVPIPVAVDLYDPYIVENLHYYESKGAEVFTHDHATIFRSLRGGDFFLCASPDQRLFYLGMLLALGRLNPILFADDPTLAQLLAIVPFGVPPLPDAPQKVSSSHRLLFGGIYDWYDPILAIDAVAIARHSLPGLTVTFNRHPNEELTPQGKAAAAIDYVERRRFDSFVEFTPWVAYEERSAHYDTFDAALLTFPPSLETDLAMRTRIFDFLWAGLPVISSPAPGTDRLLESYSAGAILQSNDPEDVAAAIVALLSDRDRLTSMSRGGRDYARDHQWDRLLEPLLAFCRNPVRDSTREQFLSADVLEIIAPRERWFDRIRRRLGRFFR